MEQAKLYILSDLSVKERDLEQLAYQCQLLDFSKTTTRFIAYKELFCHFPERATTNIQWLDKDETGDYRLYFNGISIHVSKNVIRLCVDSLFRTWVDFEDFRLVINEFLSIFLRPFGCRWLLFFPSFWEQPAGTIKNEWHERRLQAAQTKITQEAVSFKRSLQHLQYCLGTAQNGWGRVPDASYWLLPFFEIDSGKMKVWARLQQPLTDTEMERLFQTATEKIQYRCQPEWRNNNCPHLVFDAGAATLHIKQTCRLLPYIDGCKSAAEYAAKNDYYLWNRHCFFDLELHNCFLTLTFRKTASFLMGAEERKKCILFIAQLLSNFPIQKAWISSAENFDTVSQFQSMYEFEKQMEENFVFYQEADGIHSWREAILTL